MWGDVPTWLAALGTVGAVVVALVFAGRDGRRRAAQERRHQAELVTGWLVPYEPDGIEGGDAFVGLVVRNASQQSVYQMIASLVSVQGAFRETAVGDKDRGTLDFRSFPGQIPPGEHRARLAWGGGGMYLRFGVELAFQDAAGRCWLRLGNGQLREIDKNPVDLYEVPRPVEWDWTLSNPGDG